MPRPSDQVVNIPPEELRVVLSPSGEMTMWVPIFAEQPGSTIVHADGTVLCRGGPFYHEDLQKAYAAYMERKAKEQARRPAVVVEPANEPAADQADGSSSEPVTEEQAAREPVERPAAVRPKVVRPSGPSGDGPSNRAASR